jgi:HEAT repeat protein
MLSDRETTLDALGFPPYVDSLYSAIISPGITPFTIGIYGKWGTGKTSLMKMLQKRLDEQKNMKTIWFNAWKFEKEKDIWIALIQTLLNEIEVRDESKIEESKRIIRKLRYGINWIKMAGFVTSIAIQRPDFDKLSQALDLNLKERIESIYDFEVEFEKLVRLSCVERLVIFIDDLDRCKEQATLSILEAVKLFLFSKKCVYILGLDHEKICETIAKKFPKEVAEEFLDKIVQLPFFIPRTRSENMRKFLRFLFLSQYLHNLQNERMLVERVFSLREDEFDLGVSRNNLLDLNRGQMDEYRDILEQQTIIIDENDSNPRKIKRFLNAFLMRRYMKENLNIALKNEYIIKFLLLQLNYRDFHNDLERYPSLLERIQSLSSLEEKERREELEKSDLLKKHFGNKKLRSFLERMEFGNQDPRPYLLLSETGILYILSIREIEIIEDIFSDDSIKISDAVERFSQIEEKRKEYFFSQLEKEKRENFTKTILLQAHGIKRNRLVDSLAAIGPSAIDPLLDLLVKTGSDNLRSRISDVLKKTRDSQAVGPLIDLLEKADDDNLIWRISDILGEIGDPVCIDPLLSSLEKTDNDGLRWKISDDLGRMKSEAVGPLIELLERTEDDDLKRKVSYALGKIGDPAAIDPLLGLLEKTDNNRLKWKVLDVLAKIGSQAVGPLIELLERTEDDDLRRKIFIALSKVGSQAVDPLIELLERTEDDGLKREVSYTLGEMGDPAAIDPLLNLLEKTESILSRKMVEKALEKLRS